MEPGAPDQPASYRLGSWLFLRALAAIYLAAFASLKVQLSGLLGSRGILPVSESLAWARQALGARAFLEVPTLFWLGSSDAALSAACIVGAVFAVALGVGYVQRPALIALWLLYLSVVSVGDVFLGFQWDVLLLEAGLLAILLAPPGWRPVRPERLPSRAGTLWLFRWLLFRLMFLSGLVKLGSGDPAWRSLTALEYHYWTQPLPTWIAFYVNALPAWLHRLTTLAMFGTELVLPFFIFGRRRWARRAAAAGFLLLQLGISLTGNYGFFNLLTAALCLTIVDDDACRRLLRRPLDPPAEERALSPARMGAFVAFATVVMAVSVLVAVQRWDRRGVLPDAARAVLERVEPFRSINTYGLFAVMTTTRPEIEVSGSNDGFTWRPYGFRWKPGPPDRAPVFLIPHMPRLDWQMWFAALGSCTQNPWFLQFQKRLLEGSPEVLGLLREDPFAGTPPRFVRTVVYDYRFAPASEGLRRGIYWERTEQGPYCPPLELRDGELVRAELPMR